jgi:predicted transposase YbfD/YdcC
MSTLIKIDAGREIKGVLHRETRYCISDETVSSPSCYLSPASGHRGIENRLHRHPDVTFREDACRAREGNAPYEFIHAPKIYFTAFVQPKG